MYLLVRRAKGPNYSKANFFIFAGINRYVITSYILTSMIAQRTLLEEYYNYQSLSFYGGKVNMNHFRKLSIITVLLSFIMLAGMATSAVAADGDVKHKLVIQVSSDDPQTQTIALNNAVNLQKMYGMDNVAIEVVAYGPGLGLLTTKSKEADRVKSLAMQNITFSACGNTMAKIEKKTGKKPQLTEGVGTVQAGVARIMELQEEGYSYLRP